MSARWTEPVGINRHTPYWHERLQADFCHADGEPWPCLHSRQNPQPRCRCSHVKDNHGTDRRGHVMCFSVACGCGEYRPDKTIPARFDERNDPDLIDRPCSRCEGCGQIANSDEGEPWSFWMDLPVKSALAVTLGLVQPIACPSCDGEGQE